MTRAMTIGLTGLLLSLPFFLSLDFLPPSPALPAAAAEPDAARFQLELSGDHVIRLDRQTGAMSLCAERDGDLVCRMAADERAAYDEQLDRLGARVTALEKAASTGSGALRMPSDAEIDRSLGIMERMMRGVIGMVQEFRREDPDEQPGDKPGEKALPQKTRSLYE